MMITTHRDSFITNHWDKLITTYRENLITTYRHNLVILASPASPGVFLLVHKEVDGGGDARAAAEH